MCVGLFSITAHADVEPNYKLFVQTDGLDVGLSSSNSFYDGDNYTKSAVPNSSFYFGLNNSYWFCKYIFTLTDDTDYILFEGGKTYDLRIDNLHLDYYLQFEDGAIWYDDPSKYVTQSLYMHFTDGTKQAVQLSISYNDKSDSFNLTGTFAPDKDVKSMYFEVARLGGLYIDSDPFLSARRGQYAYLYGFYGAQQNFSLKITNIEESKETGLLRGLSDKLTGLWDSVTNGFENLSNGITNVVNSIIELPVKIWEKISEGLKSLFVPTENDMVAYKDKWEELLSSRFGAVYEVGNIMTESWDSVMNADQTDSIEFPSATINLPDGNEFTFGGYTVQVVPNGFSYIIVAVKSIVAIVCTVAFVNGMRKRYDEVMGVEQ